MKRLILLTLLPLAAAACEDLPSAPDDPGMRIVAGPPATDTIDSFHQQLLVVEVRDDDGVPVRGVEVTFASAVSPESPAVVSSIYAVRTTDANGRATTRLRFGTLAGEARLVIAVPSLGLSTDAYYQVQPGRPVLLETFPQALTRGDTIVPSVRAVDRHGNASALPPLLSEARTPLALTPDGRRVYGTAYGTGTVRVQVLAQVDSVTLTVVPEGWLAGYAAAGVDTFSAGIHALTLDGRQGAPVPGTAGMPEPYGIDWSPDGMYLAYGEVAGNRIMVVNTVTGATAPLGGTGAFTRAHSPQFASDGTLRFWGRSPAGEGIWTTSPAGGTPTLLVPDAPADAHLSDDGMRITYALNGRIVAEDVATRTPVDQGAAGSVPRFAPHGQVLAYVSATGEAALLRLSTGAVRTVTLPGTVYTVDWSPLGAWLLAGGSAGVFLVHYESLLVLPLYHHLRWPAFRFVQETTPPIE